METRTLGRTGLRVSAIGFGGAPLGLTNYLSAYDPRRDDDRRTAIDAIQRALELGITYFDTALGYGDGESERILGEARRIAAGRGMDVDSRMRLATKVPSGKRTYEGVLESAELSLRNLGVPHVDCPLVGMRTVAEVVRNAAIASDPTARFDLVELHRRYV